MDAGCSGKEKAADLRDDYLAKLFSRCTGALLAGLRYPDHQQGAPLCIPPLPPDLHLRPKFAAVRGPTFRPSASQASNTKVKVKVRVQLRIDVVKTNYAVMQQQIVLQAMTWGSTGRLRVPLLAGMPGRQIVRRLYQCSH